MSETGPAAAAAPPAAGGGSRGAPLGHEHLLAVGDERGQVDAAALGAPRQPAGPRDRVGDARALRQAHEAGPAHRARDVDDERGRRRQEPSGGSSGRGGGNDRRDPNGVGRAAPGRDVAPGDDDHDEREQCDGEQPSRRDTERERGHGATVPMKPSRVGNASVTKLQQLAGRPLQPSPRTISPSSPVEHDARDGGRARPDGDRQTMVAEPGREAIRRRRRAAGSRAERCRQDARPAPGPGTASLAPTR